MPNLLKNYDTSTFEFEDNPSLKAEDGFELDCLGQFRITAEWRDGQLVISEIDHGYWHGKYHYRPFSTRTDALSREICAAIHRYYTHEELLWRWEESVEEARDAA